MPVPSRFAALMFAGLTISTVRAGDAAATRISKTWDLESSKWKYAVAAADTPEARTHAAAARPDLSPYLKDMWAQLNGNLAEAWTLPHAAWFLRAAPTVLKSRDTGAAIPIFAAEIETIRTALEKHHIKSPGLIPVCMALATFQDPRSLDTLKKIATGNPDAKIQGVAALAAAMVMKSLGDDSRVMRERLTFLREAIIKSSDVDVGGTTVAKVAEDELYIIRFLSKGRIAPDLAGAGSGGQQMKLSDFSGKVVLLLFWGSNVMDAEQTVKITNELIKRMAGKPFVVIGVNRDPVAKLRALEADGTVTWKNFADPDGKIATQFRVGSWPLAIVLDGTRKIQYSGPPGSFAELTAEALLADAPAEP
ncbi:MAG: TlpA disulfide reductase family protein [Verrucomicrobiota bacterium]